MLFGTVALVLGKTIAGIAVVELIHEHVTECFGDDGRRRNDRDQRVAVHNGFLARGRWPARRALPEQRLGDRLVAVDEQPFGPDFQHAGGVAHGLERRLQNIDAIDFGRPDDAKPPSQRHGPDLGGLTVPAGRRQHLGVRKAGNNRAFGQNHRRRNHGTGKAAPPGFIDPGNRRNGYAGEPVARLRGRAQKQLFLHGYGFFAASHILSVTKDQKGKKGSLQERSLFPERPSPGGKRLTAGKNSPLP